MKSKVDILYRSLLFSKFFVKGWGFPKRMKLLLDLRNKFSLRKNIEEFITGTDVRITSNILHDDKCILHGEFLSPLARKFPSLIPQESHLARFEIILPCVWKDKNRKAICIHLAGTGDHFFWRRRHFMANPLVEEANIGAVILENPFYGFRKPKKQLRSNLYYVSDIFVMGACLITECFVLLKWCESQGYGPLGITGVSMGGHMASLAAAAWPKPIVLVPCLSWTTASSVFTDGVMAKSIDWKLLTNQFYGNPDLARLVEWKRASDTCALIEQTTSGDVMRHNVKLHVQRFSKLAQLYEFIDVQKHMKIQKYLYSNRVLTSTWKIVVEFVTKRYKRRDENVKQFMRLLMDEFTDLRKYPKLVEPQLCISIVARYDAYVPRDGCADMAAIWNGVDVRMINAGHVSGIVRYNNIFRDCIIEAFDRAHRMNQFRGQTINLTDRDIKLYSVLDLPIIVEH